MVIDFLSNDFIDSLLTDDVCRFIHLLITDVYDPRHYVFIQYSDGRCRVLRDLDEIALDDYMTKAEGNDLFKDIVKKQRYQIISKITK